jgi:ABC-type multidrug transport system fused ATPase/permease subunit
MKQIGGNATARPFIACSSLIVRLSAEDKGTRDVTEPTVEQKFLEKQYTALRTEGENAAERAFKIFATSVLVVPAGLALGGAVGSNVLPLIKMLLPLLLLAFYAMYWAQIFATYRTGLYIRSRLEPRLLSQEQGWESWISERRYLYDAQMNVAFVSLAAVYYFGTVYLATTVKVEGSHLKGLMNFLDATDLGIQTLSSEHMLFIFYALAVLAMGFLVQLVPGRQLREEEKIEQILTGDVQGTTDKIQAQLKQSKSLKDVKETLKIPESRDFKAKGHIKSRSYFTDPFSPQAKSVRLTIRKAAKDAHAQALITTLVGVLTLLGVLLWAFMLIYHFYQNMVLAGVSVVILLLLLVIPYHYLIGKNTGAKLYITLIPANGEKTDYIMRTSLERPRG